MSMAKGKLFVAVALVTLTLFGVLALPLSWGHPPAWVGESWVAQAPLLKGREGAAGAFVNGVFIMSHGYAGGTDTTDAYVILPTGLQAPLPSAAVARSELVGAAAQVGPNPATDTRYYAIGGRGGACPGSVCSTVEIFNPVTLTWAFGAPMPTARAGIGAATIGNLIYVVGGRTCGTPACGAPLATLEVYDPVANTWAAGPPMPKAVMDVYSTTSIGCDLFVVGGHDGFSDVATTQQFDTCTGAWSILAPMPTARSNAIAGVCEGHIFVIGGTVSGVDVSTVETLEPSPFPGVWATAPSLPTPASEMAAGAVSWPATSPGQPGKILAVGSGIFGFSGTPNSLMTCYPNVQPVTPTIVTPTIVTATVATPTLPTVP